MTKDQPQTAPALMPWDVPALYAASFGLFAPGALMAARLRAETSEANLQDEQNRSQPAR